MLGTGIENVFILHSFPAERSGMQHEVREFCRDLFWQGGKTLLRQLKFALIILGFYKEEL